MDQKKIICCSSVGTWNNGFNSAVFQGEPNLHTLNHPFNPATIPEEIVSITNGFKHCPAMFHIACYGSRAITQRNGSATSLVMPALPY